MKQKHISDNDLIAWLLHRENLAATMDNEDLRWHFAAAAERIKELTQEHEQRVAHAEFRVAEVERQAKESLRVLVAKDEQIARVTLERDEALRQLDEATREVGDE